MGRGGSWLEFPHPLLPIILIWPRNGSSVGLLKELEVPWSTLPTAVEGLAVEVRHGWLPVIALTMTTSRNDRVPHPNVLRKLGLFQSPVGH